jgi:hypothetical protein
MANSHSFYPYSSYLTKRVNTLDATAGILYSFIINDLRTLCTFENSILMERYYVVAATR